jgi:ABC-type multidrug transport system fused ATPase/permease subunit
VLDREPRMTVPADAPPLPSGNGHVSMRGVTLRYDDDEEFAPAYPSEGAVAVGANGDGAARKDSHGRARARLTVVQAAISPGRRRTRPGASGHANGPAGAGDAERARAPAAAGSARAVLSDVDLEVRAGRTIALVGATGSGKTSLVSLISRLYDVSSGSVLLDGADVRSVDLRS